MDTFIHDLLSAMGSENGMERKRARETAVLMGDSIAPAVSTLLDGDEKRLRWEAAKTLVAIVDPPSTGVLIALLRDQESDLRWIAADGLINLGPRSVVPLLESLLADPPTKGQVQMTGRVLRRLASENDVLQEIAAPVIEVLTDTVTPAILEPRVSRALRDLAAVTGRLPQM
jgi:HEAT repeat protein